MEKRNELRRITALELLMRKRAQEKIVAVTAYDYLWGSIVDEAGVDVVLVGDSLGMVVQGHATTLPTTLDEMIYHARCVTRGVKRALVVGDLPFLSYQISPEQACLSAGRMIKEAEVGAIKLEGGVALAATIEKLVSAEIPVMGHVGLTPQSFHRMGGFKQQGRQHRSDGQHALEQAGTFEKIMEDAQAVAQAGAFAVVLEGVPAQLAQKITESIGIPTIGIAAGEGCDGQVMVTPDLLGLTGDEAPPFVKQYAELRSTSTAALKRFAEDVRLGHYTLKNTRKGAA